MLLFWALLLGVLTYKNFEDYRLTDNKVSLALSGLTGVCAFLNLMQLLS